MASVTALRGWSPEGRVALGALAVIGVVAVAGPLIVGDGATRLTGDLLAPPSPQHPLGTDELGVDLLAQLVAGTTTSTTVAVTAGLIAGLGGAALGLWSALRGGRIDAALRGVADAAMALPELPVMILIGIALDPGLGTVVLAVVVFAWTGPYRDVRSQALALRGAGSIRAARGYGAGSLHLIRRHLLPHVGPLVAVGVVRVAGRAVAAEAALAFLGLGDPRTPSWGSTLSDALGFPGIFFTDAWTWWALPPLLAIVVLVVAIALALRETERRGVGAGIAG